MPDADWRELLSRDDRLILGPPAELGALAAAEAALGTQIGVDLRRLYEECDGVFDGAGQWFVIWPLAEMVTRNLEAWTSEGNPRFTWLAFGDDGTGNPFCVPRDGGCDVHYWSQIDGAASRMATDIGGFWQAWTAGALRY